MSYTFYCFDFVNNPCAFLLYRQEIIVYLILLLLVFSSFPLKIYFTPSTKTTLIIIIIIMGIENFYSLFDSGRVVAANKSSTHIFVDGNLYWMKLQQDRAGFLVSFLSEAEFTREFVRFLFEDLLALEMLRSADNYDQQMKMINIVFDNANARNFLKMWRCYKRIESKSHTPSVRVNLERIRYYIDEFRRTMHISHPEYCPEAAALVQVVEAEKDTDDLVVTQCFKLQKASPAPCAKRTLTTKLAAADTADGTDKGEEDEGSSYAKIAVSSISIFSADTDFMAYFPRSQQVAVYTLNNVRGSPALFLLNAQLSNTCEIVEQIRELASKYSQAYVRLEFDYVFDISIRLFAQASPNDYITCSFFDIGALDEALGNTFLWHRALFKPVKTPKPVDFCSKRKRHIEYDEEGEEDGSSTAKISRTNDDDVNARASSEESSAAAKEESQIPIDPTDENFDLITSSDVPLTCFFAYWTKYLAKVCSTNTVKMKALVNNILRIFMVYFPQAPVLEDPSAPSSTSSDEWRMLKKGQEVCFSVPEFQHISITGISNKRSRAKELLTLDELYRYLTGRWLAFYDRPFCEQLEKNFKPCLNSVLKSRPDNDLPRENLAEALKQWMSMHVLSRQKGYLSSRSGELEDVDMFLKISSLLLLYATIFFIGVGRVWFFQEYEVAQQNNKKLDGLANVSGMFFYFYYLLPVEPQISLLSFTLITLLPSLSSPHFHFLASAWFHFLCLAIFETFMPCTLNGDFEFRPNEPFTTPPRSTETRAKGERRKGERKRANESVGNKNKGERKKWSYSFHKYHAAATYFVREFI